MVNQNPEQLARNKIDVLLEKAGWVVQDKKTINFAAALGVALREYQTDVGPVDYVLFVNKQAAGVIGAKPEAWGEKIVPLKNHVEQTVFVESNSKSKRS